MRGAAAAGPRKPPLLLGGMPPSRMAPPPRGPAAAPRARAQATTPTRERLHMPWLRSPLPRRAILRGLSSFLPGSGGWRVLSLLRRAGRLRRAEPAMIRLRVEGQPAARTPCSVARALSPQSTLSSPFPRTPIPALLLLLLSADVSPALHLSSAIGPLQCRPPSGVCAPWHRLAVPPQTGQPACGASLCGSWGHSRSAL